MKTTQKGKWKMVEKKPEKRHFLMSCKVQFCIVIFSILLFFVISLVMNPSYVDPIYYEPPNLVHLIGPLFPNQRLNKTKILNIPIKGGESFVFHDESLFTGTHDGNIAKMFKDQNLEFARFGPKNCNKTYECGRPLGLRLCPSKDCLYALDAYFGLYKVYLADGRYEKLFPTSAFPIDSSPVHFFNDFDVFSDGVFILTDSSSKHPYHKMVFNFIEGSSLGKVLLVDTNKITVRVLAQNLFFPNGVQITRDKKYALISETGNNRILKIRIPHEDSFDPLEGKVDLFTPDLPGLPDNIRMSPRGGYWIALPHLSFSGNPGILHKTAHYPTMRWLAHKLLTPSLIYYLASSKASMIVRVDEEGKIVESHQIHGSSHVNVAEVLELANGTMFLGSFYLSNLRRLDLASL